MMDTKSPWQQLMALFGHFLVVVLQYSFRFSELRGFQWKFKRGATVQDVMQVLPVECDAERQRSPLLKIASTPCSHFLLVCRLPDCRHAKNDEISWTTRWLPLADPSSVVGDDEREDQNMRVRETHAS